MEGDRRCEEISQLFSELCWEMDGPDEGPDTVTFLPSKWRSVAGTTWPGTDFCFVELPYLTGIGSIDRGDIAGNAVVLKPSELAPACSSFLANTIPLYLDSNAIKVVEGGADIAEQLLQQKWDKIFFTGSQRVGKIVMTAAAKHLTPVTLELGGKCPIILDSLSNPSDIKVAAKRIVGAKWGPCSGQACIAIDYVLVEHKFASTLLTNIQDSIEFINSRPKPLALYAFTKNEAFKQRILTETSSGSLTFNDAMLQFIPSIQLNGIQRIFKWENTYLKIFHVETCQNPLKSRKYRQRPHRTKFFSRWKIYIYRVFLLYSAVCCDSLPFGGVGQSGFGRYHGKYSFDTFSHEKAVLHRSFLIELEARYPPWNDFKLQFIRFGYKFDYLRLVLLLMGQS
ncbi:hypothetical protein C3L33_22058, partial [Rhododendron williamsianum]